MMMNDDAGKHDVSDGGDDAIHDDDDDDNGKMMMTMMKVMATMTMTKVTMENDEQHS